ncbi:MAG: GNAT family N-acetyltransferase [Phenylobacterium sp.]|nr:GNAT family N-acetyltransferase [Phenylobacterium sp.]
MNPQLERIGRLDVERSIARFLREFRPGDTWLIHADGAFAGCVTIYDAGDAWVIEHFYLTPDRQGAGLGGEVLRQLLAEADAAHAPVRLSVLVGSPANRFYPRHGFVETHREPFDIHYRRNPGD